MSRLEYPETRKFDSTERKDPGKREDVSTKSSIIGSRGVGVLYLHKFLGVNRGEMGRSLETTREMANAVDR